MDTISYKLIVIVSDSRYLWEGLLLKGRKGQSQLIFAYELVIICCVPHVTLTLLISPLQVLWIPL